MEVIKILWIVWLSMLAPIASAQSGPSGNVFFGFDFVLQPVAVKWACGGTRDHDLAAFETLLAAFPEDAKNAQLQKSIDAMLHVPEGVDGLAKIVGSDLTEAQTERLCRAAKSLSVAWLTPIQIVDDDEDGIPVEQRETWAEFWRVVEGLQ